MDLPLHQLLTVTVPVGDITETGKTEIEKFLNTAGLPALPEDWKWVATITGKAEYPGTFSKRVSKYMHLRHQIAVAPTLLQDLGQLVTQHTHDRDTYVIDFTDKIDWTAGEFGDKGSCFFGYSGEPARACEILQAHGVHAIRLYAPEVLEKVTSQEYLDLPESKRYAYLYNWGRGRAWLYRHELRFSTYIYALFNGYGWEGGSRGFDNTLIASRVFSAYTGLHYKKVNLQNWGNDRGTIYINSGRRGVPRGVIFGEPAVLQPLNHVSLNIGSPDDDDYDDDDYDDYAEYDD